MRGDLKVFGSELWFRESDVSQDLPEAAHSRREFQIGIKLLAPYSLIIFESMRPSRTWNALCIAFDSETVRAARKSGHIKAGQLCPLGY
jgi:hypothetical protein